MAAGPKGVGCPTLRPSRVHIATLGINADAKANVMVIAMVGAMVEANLAAIVSTMVGITVVLVHVLAQWLTKRLALV